MHKVADSITIITNEYTSRIDGSRYFLAALARRWRQQGIEVNITAGCSQIPADLAFMHVDTTVVPDNFLALGRQYRTTINGGVRDILKTSISKHLLRQNDLYDGPVIVKTNANYGGVNEFIIATETGRAVSCDPDVERPWRKREIMDSLNYPIFASIRDVPTGVWKNDKLVVEKFLSERLANGDFRSYCYYFFGQQDFAAWLCGPRPVLKSSVTTSMGVLDPIPQAVRDYRKASGFDYGKIDFSIVDGEIIVFDLNKTPAFSTQMQGLVSSRQLDEFADEIHRFG